MNNNKHNNHEEDYYEEDNYGYTQEELDDMYRGAFEGTHGYSRACSDGSAHGGTGGDGSACGEAYGSPGERCYQGADEG